VPDQSQTRQRHIFLRLAAGQSYSISSNFQTVTASLGEVIASILQTCRSPSEADPAQESKHSAGLRMAEDIKHLTSIFHYAKFAT
jgi:hypothetical protein